MSDPFDVSEFSKMASAMADPSGADRGLAVRFFTDEVEDPVETLKAGRPVFKTVEFCEIRIPGDKSNVRCGRVEKMQPDPRMRFADAYARFQRGERVQVQGTMLREWPLMSRAEARGMEAAGIYTVEQLAELTDQNARNLLGSMAARQKAKDFLSLGEKMAPLNQARAENEKLRSEMQALREMVESLGGKPVQSSEAASVKVRKKPGPKPKTKPSDEPQPLQEN